MAEYHLSAQVLSRSKGRNVVNAAAYRAAERLHDERLGQTFAYERKQGVVHVEILVPDGSPDWVRDREKLWNRAEKAEKRVDSQVAREVRLGLPRELTKDQQVELLQEYVNQEFVSRGMVADVCLHHDNPENPHAHVLLTTRAVEGDGFAKKKMMSASEWKERKDELQQWREQWSARANIALERAGHDIRIDHRSYKDRGIALEPQSKIGVNREDARGDGRYVIQERLAEHDELARRNGEAIRENPLIAIEALTHQRSTFTRSDVGRWLNTRTYDAEQFQACLDGVMGSPELISLGQDAKGNDRYTSREMLEAERRMMRNVRSMAARDGHAVEARYVEQAATSRTMSPEQRAAFEHIVKSGDVAVVEGYAGTGKSYMLGAAREAWEAQGYRVRGGALAGKAAEGLEVSAGIPSKSLHSWEYAWKNDRDPLTSKDVLVIDEGGMVGSRQMGRILAHAEKAGAKVVIAGDRSQLQAIEAGAPLRAIVDEVGCVTLEDIRRQRHDWQKAATLRLANKDVGSAIDEYDKHGFVHVHEKQSEALRAVVTSWRRDRQEHPGQEQIILAYRRKEVQRLNELARGYCKDAGELGEDHTLETARGSRKFAEGDRIYFLKNDRQLGVMNGTLGTVEGIKGSSLVVRLDGDENRRMAFDARHYDSIDHGYAATVHKAQGVTVDRAYVLASDVYDRSAAYVALSRQRDHVEMHWSEEQFGSERRMREQLKRGRPKELAIDYVDAHHLNRDLAADVAARRVERERGELETEKLKVEWHQAKIRHHTALEQWVRYAKEHPERAAHGHRGIGEAGHVWQWERKEDKNFLEVDQKLRELGQRPASTWEYSRAQIEELKKNREREAAVERARAQRSREPAKGKDVEPTAGRSVAASDRGERPKPPAKNQADELEAAWRQAKVRHHAALESWMHYKQMQPEAAAVVHRGEGMGGRRWESERQADKKCLELESKLRELGRKPAPLSVEYSPAQLDELKRNREREAAFERSRAHREQELEKAKGAEALAQEKFAEQRSGSPTELRLQELEAKQVEAVKAWRDRCERFPERKVDPDPKARESLRSSAIEASKELREAYGEVRRTFWEQNRTARTAPTTTKDQWQKLPEVGEAKRRIQWCKERLAGYAYQREQYRREHPVKAALGGEPRLHDSATGQTRPLSDWEREGQKELKEAKRALETAAGDPKLRARAQQQAREHNGAIRQAQDQQKEIQPLFDRADKGAERLIREQRELGRELGRWRGFDRGMER